MPKITLRDLKTREPTRHAQPYPRPRKRVQEYVREGVFPFFKLPQELRDMVYFHAFPRVTVFDPERREDKPKKELIFEPENKKIEHRMVFKLLQINRQMRFEVHEAFRTFQLQFSIRVKDIPKFIDAIGKPGRQAISSLKLREFVWVPNWIGPAGEPELFNHRKYDTAYSTRRMFDWFDKHSWPNKCVKHLVVQVEQFFPAPWPQSKTPYRALCNENHPQNLNRFGRFDSFKFEFSEYDRNHSNMTEMLAHTNSFYEESMIKNGKRRTW